MIHYRWYFSEINADSASQLKLSQHARSKLSKIGVFQRLENQTEIWPSLVLVIKREIELLPFLENTAYVIQTVLTNLLFFFQEILSGQNSRAQFMLDVVQKNFTDLSSLTKVAYISASVDLGSIGKVWKLRLFINSK